MPDNSLDTRIAAALDAAKARLLAERHPAGHWRGHLSSSALSTATAIIALSRVDLVAHGALIEGGLRWLAENQHATGGWGDTTRSLPNISTTLLVWAAFGAAHSTAHPSTMAAAEAWIAREAGSLDPAALAGILKKRYGKDQTFSVPILMACALGGRLGPEPACWRLVPQLPFQLAAFPRSWYAALSLPVVSYALPALIAIGQVRHFHYPRGPAKLLRSACRKRTLRLLRELQPASGGFLEATPLTSFVTMALAGMNQGHNETASHAVQFLLHSARPDGSWPIDTDLATWGTTLSVKALGPEAAPENSAILSWLLVQQYRAIHPYTLSAPGGWAWTDLPGGVPDADDTSGALAALANLGDRRDPQIREAAAAGVRWLLGLQNRDGGIPTFCRGWGALPFDRSTAEITAHALAGFAKWPDADASLPHAEARALRYLEKNQASDGSWTPLWFGNQWNPGETNPVYGTASVLRDLATLASEERPVLTRLRSKAAAFLLKQQYPDGSWGATKAVEAAHPSIEETALALHALANLQEVSPTPELAVAIEKGASALLALTKDGTEFTAAPIGLYFARLWYHERLYPLIWTTAALRAVQYLRRSASENRLSSEKANDPF